MKLLGLSLVLAISSGALGLRVSYSGDVSDPGDDGAGPTTAGPQQLDGWAPYVRDKSGNRPLFNRSTAEKDFIPIFITDNAKAGNPVYLDPDVAVGSNGTVVGQENVTWKVESSSGFEAWLDSLTSVDGASGGQQKKNLVLLFGSASTGYSQHSWEAMQEPLTKKFDDLDEEFQDQGGWILVTNGDGYYNSKSLTDIAVHVAQRGTPVVFVQSDYGGTFPSVKEDKNNYWPPYACGGLFGHGIDHGIPEFKPDGKTFKGKKHCWGGIAKSGWLEKDLATLDLQAFGDKVAEDKKAGIDVEISGGSQIVPGSTTAEVYAFPDKAFLKGCKKMGHFPALESRLAQVIVVGGGAITLEQMEMYKGFVTLLIETTDAQGNEGGTTDAKIQESATRFSTHKNSDGSRTPASIDSATQGVLSPK